MCWKLGTNTEVVCVVAVGFADVRGHVCGVPVSRECGDSVSRGVGEWALGKVL